MAVSDATWLDQEGHVRLVGQLDGDFGGLPTGWTQAGDPADVASNDGSLDLGAGSLAATGLTSSGSAVLTDVQVLGDVGFYGVSPIAQPAVPVTLGDVIAALQDLGLVAT